MKIILIFLLSIFSLTSFAQIGVLNGSVKSVRVKILLPILKKSEIYVDENGDTREKIHDRDYTAVYGDVFRDPDFRLKGFAKKWYYTNNVDYLNYKKTFSKSGKPIDEIWYYENDSEVANIKYFYDEKDSLSLKIYSNYNIDSTIYSYNEFGKSEVKHLINFNNESEKYSSKLYYDKNKLIREDKFEGNLFTNSTIYNYDNSNNLTEMIGYYPKTHVDVTKIKSNDDLYATENYRFKYVENFYDDKNRVIQIDNYTGYYNENKMYKTTKYKYDENSNIIEEQIFNLLNNSNTIIYYTFKNNLLQTKNAVNFKKEKNNSYEMFYYNEMNNLVKFESERDGKLTEVSFNYKFDRKGNWTKQVKKIKCDGIIKKFILKRKIKYYTE